MHPQKDGRRLITKNQKKQIKTNRSRRGKQQNNDKTQPTILQLWGYSSLQLQEQDNNNNTNQDIETDNQDKPKTYGRNYEHKRPQDNQSIIRVQSQNVRGIPND